MIIEQVIKILEKYGIKAVVRDGYITLPQEHCFAVWTIPRRKADGADGYALYWTVTYEVRICYRDQKTAEDIRREKLIENELRELENLESEYLFDSKDKLDITVYDFTDTEDFEEE